MSRSYWRVCVAPIGAALRDIAIDQEAHRALGLDQNKLEWNIAAQSAFPHIRDEDDERPEEDGLPFHEGHNIAAKAARQLIAEHPQYSDRVRVQYIDDSFDGERVMESADLAHDFIDVDREL